MSYPEPRYRGEKGEISAKFRPANQKPELTIGSGTAVRYLSTGASTHGQFGLYRWDAKPHTPGPAAHFHKNMSESFFVLAGHVRVSTANAGSTQRQEIFCLFRKAACMASRMTPTKRRPC